MKKKIIIIGAGGWGINHVRNILSHPDWELIGCVDINPKIHDRLISEFQIPKSMIYTDYRDALKKTPPDAAIITVPNPHRIPMIRDALKKKLDLFIDKPLAHHPKDLKKIIQWQKKYKSIIMVAQNYRFDPLTRIIRDNIQSGRFGILSHILIQFLKDASGFTNPVYLKMSGDLALAVEMCIHQFDLLRFLLKSEPVKIMAQSWRPKWAWGIGNTGLHILMEFPKNIHITFYADWAKHNITSWGGKWYFTFDKGILDWEQGSNYGAIWKSRPVGDAKIQEIIQSNADPNKDWSPPSSLLPAFEEFTRSVLSRKRPESDLSDNIKSMGISFAVVESCRSGKIIDYNKFMKTIGLI